MSPEIFCLVLSLLPVCFHCQTTYPGSEPLNVFDAFTQVAFDPQAWVRKLYRADVLNTYTRERLLLPFYPLRRSPFTRSPSTTLNPTPYAIVSTNSADDTFQI